MFPAATGTLHGQPLSANAAALLRAKEAHARAALDASVQVQWTPLDDDVPTTQPLENLRLPFNVSNLSVVTTQIMDANDIERLAHLLQKSTQVTSVTLQTIGLHEMLSGRFKTEAFYALATALAEMPNLQRLDLSKNHLGNPHGIEVTKYIVGKLNSSSSLRVLNLQSNNFSLEQRDVIRKLLNVRISLIL